MIERENREASWRFFTKRHRVHLLINAISHIHLFYRSRIFISWFSHIYFVNEVNLSSSCKFYYIKSFDLSFSFFFFSFLFLFFFFLESRDDERRDSTMSWSFICNREIWSRARVWDEFDEKHHDVFFTKTHRVHLLKLKMTIEFSFIEYFV